MRVALERLVSRLAPGAVSVWLAASPRAAHADSLSVFIDVTRAPESRSCPDASGILGTARELFPEVALLPVAEARQAALSVAVSIRRTTEGHEAILVVRGRRQGQRRIVDADDDCRGLGHALAVALVLIIEPDAEPPERPSGAQAALPSRPPAPPRARATAEAGALGGLGLVGRPALGGFLGLGLWHESGLGLRGRAVRLWAEPTQKLRGEVAVDLWASMFGPCWRVDSGKSWSLSPCVELGWGSQRGVATRYVTPRASASRRWLVLGPSLTVTRALLGPVEGMMSVGMTARLHEQTFSIVTPDGSQTVQHQELAGAYLALGLIARWPI